MPVSLASMSAPAPEGVRRSPRKHIAAVAAGEVTGGGPSSKRSKTADPVGSLLILRDPEPDPALREKAAKCELLRPIASRVQPCRDTATRCFADATHACHRRPGAMRAEARCGPLLRVAGCARGARFGQHRHERSSPARKGSSCGWHKPLARPAAEQLSAAEPADQSAADDDEGPEKEWPGSARCRISPHLPCCTCRW